jgi:glycosyltransferase involved in cell wall biosynthesis
MQTRFAYEMFQVKPDVIFFPVQAVPFVLPRRARVIFTVHDLAFLHFPETFPATHRLKLSLFLERAIRRADRIIAVSAATKRDLLATFPAIPPERVKVIHHGYRKLDDPVLPDVENRILADYGLARGKYVLYVGALQPRKNLVRLIEAFEVLADNHPEARLVLAGEEAWLAGPTIAAVETSHRRENIVRTGRVDKRTLGVLYRNSRLFAFPSLYEGFGLPILEAFAARVPVLTADNSSLPEVGGDAALYCNARDTTDIAEKLDRLWEDENLRRALVARGAERLKEFSWDRAAAETLAWIKER